MNIDEFKENILNNITLDLDSLTITNIEDINQEYFNNNETIFEEFKFKMYLMNEFDHYSMKDRFLYIIMLLSLSYDKCLITRLDVDSICEDDDVVECLSLTKTREMFLHLNFLYADNHEYQMKLKLLNKLCKNDIHLYKYFSFDAREKCVFLLNKVNIEDYINVLSFLVDNIGVYYWFERIVNDEVNYKYKLLEMMLDKGIEIHNYYFYRIVFEMKDIGLVRLIVQKISSLDNIVVPHVNAFPSFEENDEVEKDIIVLLSSLEGFDDFIKRNINVLKETLNDKTIQYINSIV